MTAKTPTAYWPTPSLLRSLSRAGWGEIGGRSNQGVRNVLRALIDLLPDKSGRGSATAWQLAHVAGYSEKWARLKLADLEELGLIVWHRGGIIDGRPAPSFFEIVKSRLVDLIVSARRSGAEKVQAHRDKTAKRLAGMKRGAAIFNLPKSKTKRHAELSANLSTPYGGVPRGTHPGKADETPLRRKRNAFTTLRNEQERKERERHSKDFDNEAARLIAQGVTAFEAYGLVLKQRLGIRQ